MKTIVAITLLMALCFANASHELNPKDSNEVLTHLQGNNYNIYILFFQDPHPSDDATKSANKDIEDRIDSVLGDNSEIFYSKIDSTDPEFAKLQSVVGVTSSPAVLMIVHGKGIWISGTNGPLVSERLRDFLPAFKQASAHHSNPY
jgi:hypothetical protein